MVQVQRRISVLGVAVLNKKLLSVRHTPYNGPRSIDFWCLPGGGLEKNESLRDGVVRELLEETGVKPEVGNLLYVQQFHDGNKEFIEFFFHIKNPTDYSSVDLSKSSHGEIEIAEIDFIDPKKHTLLPKFLQTEDFTDLENRQTKFFSYL